MATITCSPPITDWFDGDVPVDMMIVHTASVPIHDESESLSDDNNLSDSDDDSSISDLDPFDLEHDEEICVFFVDENGEPDDVDTHTADQRRILEARRAVERRRWKKRMEKAQDGCYLAIGDKLTWLSETPAFELPERDSEQYPILSATNPPKERVRCARVRNERPIPSLMVRHARHPGFTFDRPVVSVNVLCRAIQQGRVCSYGHRCKFIHPVDGAGALAPAPAKLPQPAPTPAVTRPKVAALPALMSLVVVPPTPPAVPAAPVTKPTTNNKKFFCKNVRARGTCKFGDDCQFAHTKEEMRLALEDCHFGKQCKRVRSVMVKFVKGGKTLAYYKYQNSPHSRCARRHPGETINNYIARMNEPSV